MAKIILLVDDDVLVRKGLSTGLVEKGYEVIEASDGKEGIELALDKHPNLIVADVRMPKMDGFEMIKEIRKDSWGATVPVIVMSTDDATTSVNQALEAGVTVYLAKSTLTPDALADQVSSSLPQ